MLPAHSGRSDSPEIINNKFRALHTSEFKLSILMSKTFVEAEQGANVHHFGHVSRYYAVDVDPLATSHVKDRTCSPNEG